MAFLETRKMQKFSFAGALAACEILDVPPITVSALWRANCCRECENGDRFAPSSVYFWTHVLRIFHFWREFQSKY